MNHKWLDNTCTRCGVKREKKSWKRLMAVINHPPWEAWVYGNGWHYGKTGFKRPNCNAKPNTQLPNLEADQTSG